MGTWTKQKGYPVLTLTKEKDGTVYRVVQVKSGTHELDPDLFMEYLK